MSAISIFLLVVLFGLWGTIEFIRHVVTLHCRECGREIPWSRLDAEVWYALKDLTRLRRGRSLCDYCHPENVTKKEIDKNDG